jgi:hypothetical protein
LQETFAAFTEADTSAAAVAATAQLLVVFTRESYSRSQSKDNRRDKSKSPGRTSTYCQKKGVTAGVSAR